jgi:RNA polymerase sigma-70 factor (ECF subfamily)
METDVGRQARFESIVDEVYEPLQRYFGRRARADDVSELLNDALMIIWRRLDDVPTDDARPWSYGVAKRCLANHRRGNERRLRLVGRLAAEPLTRERLGERPMVDGDHDELLIALGELDEPARELVRLWAWEQLEPREIAIVLGTTVNAVSVRLTRAKKKLASSMQRQNVASAGQEGFGHRTETGS